MGWYDANPVNLNLLLPEESAKKTRVYSMDTKKDAALTKQDFAHIGQIYYFAGW